MGSPLSNPVRIPAVVTVTGGVATASFGSPPIGFVWTGSVSVPGASSGNVNPVTWHATAGMVPQATFYNDQASGTIQVASGDSLTLVGVNPGAGPYTAYFVGVQDTSAAAPSVWPGPTPTPPPGTPQSVIAGSFSVGAVGSTLGTVPVVVGTSVAITAAVASNAARIIVTWTAPPSNLTLESFTFDLRSGASLNGLILPNAGPQLQVSAFAAAGPVASITIQVFTGLPPITQKPVIPNGVLWQSSGTIAANATIPLVPAPYYGPVSFTFSPNNVAGFGVYITPFDYLGNTFAQIRNTQGWPAGTGPFFAQSVVFIPALLCQVTVDNSGVGSPTTYSTTGITLGP